MQNSKIEKPDKNFGFCCLVLILVFCIFLFPVSFVFADGEPPESNQPVSAVPVQSAQSRYEIGTIQIAGNRIITSNQILVKVRSKVGQLFNADMAAEDAKRIAQIDGIGYSYYNTAVVDNKIQLTFVIVEKNVVRTIDFTGNKEYNAKTLTKKLGFKKGDSLDAMLAESGRKSISDLYLEDGFPFVEVTIDQQKLLTGNLVYTIQEGPKARISSVEFSGNKAVKTRLLKTAVKTSTRKYVIFRKYYNQTEVDGDITKLQSAYYERGFLNAVVSVKREFNEEKTKVRITFVIEEGPVYKVDKIAVTGGQFFDPNRLRSEINLEQKKAYNQRKAESDAKRILALYRESGFVDTTVEQKRSFVPENQVDVEYQITEGDRFKIGQVNITGNEQTHDKVVRRILDEYDFMPGQWYNADIARGDGTGDLEKRVKNMAMTESVSITPSTPAGQTPGQKDAQVHIIEGQTGSVMLGAGVASDSGLIGQLVFEQRNFDIKDRPESFEEFITGKAFKGAGQNLRIALQPGTEVSEYSIDFTEPYFMNKPISLDVAGSFWTRGRESYNEERTKGFVGFEKRYKNHWTRSIGFRMEEVTIKDLESDAPKEIYDVEGGNMLGGVKFGVGRDTTNDRFAPSKGYIFNTAYEQVGGDYTFGILSATHRRYSTLYEDLAERKTVLATKLLFATAVGDTPPFEKFYGGGSSTYGIRGFRYRGVSTRGRPTSGGVTIPGSEKRDPIGSEWIFLAGAEAIVPLVGDNFSALFFVDSGTIDSGNYRVGVGTGIQILIPQWFGPVPMRLEIAAPLMKDSSDETQIFSFSVGRLF
jgi:outer membrane protein insertion porin family